MTDIFLSYARGDKNRIEPLVKAFEDQNWMVWWDTDLLAGSRFHDIISAQLETARCVVVVWSNLSAKSDWVAGEAETAKEARKLVPIRLDTRLDVPLNFRSIHTEDFSNWTGERDTPEFARLCNAIRAKLGAAERPVPIRMQPDPPSEKATTSDRQQQDLVSASDSKLEHSAHVVEEEGGPSASSSVQPILPPRELPPPMAPSTAKDSGERVTATPRSAGRSRVLSASIAGFGLAIAIAVTVYLARLDFTQQAAVSSPPPEPTMDLGAWHSQAPDNAYCFQRRDDNAGSTPFSIRCFRTADACSDRQPRDAGLITPCIRANGLRSSSDWVTDAYSSGADDSWRKDSAREFGQPFPSPSKS